MSSNALKESPARESSKTSAKVADLITPNWRQNARSIQKYGTVVKDLPIGLDASARQEIVAELNLLVADTITIRDLYKKSHWQVGGPTFYQLHLLYDKHAGEQSELIDTLAERVQMLGGVSIAMAHDVAANTRIERPPIDREEVPVQISRLLEAHNIILKHARKLAERADDLGDVGTNDLLAGDIVRTNEMQVWFLSEHLVEMPLVMAR
jgi:starvation-inducible DNA-binding protein